MSSSPITLACCSLAFRDEPAELVIQRFARFGYDAVEVFGKHIDGKSPDELREMRQVADDADIRLLLIAPYFILTRERKHFDETMALAERCVGAAHILGATKIRTFTDVANDGIGSDIATDAHWDQAVEGLKRICAMDRQLQFVVETHPHTLADTVESCEQLLSRVDEPNLKLNFQPTSIFVAFGLNAAYDRLQPHITHMHLHQFDAEHHGKWMEEPGDVDFADFIAHVKASGYAESISVEYCWKDVPWEKADSACGYMRKLLEA